MTNQVQTGTNQVHAGARQARIGVVLSAGGIRGVYAHTGFLQALDALGITISATVGCSAGAIVGGVAASGTDLDRWSDAIGDVAASKFWTPDSWLRFAWNMAVHKGRGYTGLSGTEAGIEFLRSQLSVNDFRDCRYPFYALAENLVTGEKVLFNDGDIAPRIMASAALPVLYRPVEIDGVLYCDGAMVSLAPTGAICCDHQLDALIISHTALRREGPPGLKKALAAPLSMVEILYLLLYRQRPWYLADEPFAITQCRAGCGVPLLVIEPELPELEWPSTENGSELQASVKAQVEALLTPHLETLKQCPRDLLSKTG